MCRRGEEWCVRFTFLSEWTKLRTHILGHKIKDITLGINNHQIIKKQTVKWIKLDHDLN